MVQHLEEIQQMKTFIHKSLQGLLWLGVLLATTATLHAQVSGEAALEKMLSGKDFVFKAQTALPLRGGSRHLTTDYDLRLSGDSLISYLPYFGRAYTAPMASDENGLQFTSTDFSYTVHKKKKGWDVTILPRDTREVREMFLSITTSGYGRLQVSSNNRDGISFNGYIDKKD